MSQEDGFSLSDEFESIEFGDKRLNSRFKKSVDKISQNPQAPIRSTFGKWSDVMGFYRLLGNPRVNKDEILQAHFQSTVERMKEHKRILVIQDTTVLSFGTHLSLDEELGSIAMGKYGSRGKGLFLHPTIAYSDQGVPLGILDHLLWSREKLTREDELWYSEQRKWFFGIDAAEKAKRMLPTTQMIVVADREGGASTETLVHALNAKTDFVFRAKYNRIGDEGEKIRQKSFESPSLGKIVLEIERQSARAASKNKKKSAAKQKRKAHLDVHVCSFTLPVQARKLQPGEKVPSNLRLQAVLVTEAQPPKGVEPVEWLLITTLEVTTFEQAFDVISIYKKRWKIETFFKYLKTGCRVEDCMVQSLDRLDKMILILSLVAWRLQGLQEVLSLQSNASCLKVMTDDEWKTLYTQVHGENRKLTFKLPKKPPTVASVVKWLGILGGHLQRKNDLPAGALLIWRGWQKLHQAVPVYRAMEAQLGSSV